jgi:pimeloyl-ACP methyl ester carboxylesterase
MKVQSADGSQIGYDVRGEGPAVILVNGALGDRELDRKFKMLSGLTGALSSRFAVVNYDRRGRGESSEAGPFAVEREVEDIAALIDAVGGRAALVGFSSGGALALRAAAAGVGVQRAAVYEPPFMVERTDKIPAEDYAARMDELLAAGDGAGAVRHFMRGAIGLPAPLVAMMRLMPAWKGMVANAHTLPYDWAALGDHNMHGEPLRAAEFSSVEVPVLVAYGAKSPSRLQSGSRALAEVLPAGRACRLEGVGHRVKAEVLAPPLGEFLAERAPIRRGESPSRALA